VQAVNQSASTNENILVEPISLSNEENLSISNINIENVRPIVGSQFNELVGQLLNDNDQIISHSPDQQREDQVNQIIDAILEKELQSIFAIVKRG
jgi:hypothetical protein